jgi:hypothetical protein
MVWVQVWGDDTTSFDISLNIWLVYDAICIFPHNPHSAFSPSLSLWEEVAEWKWESVVQPKAERVLYPFPYHHCHWLEPLDRQVENQPPESQPFVHALRREQSLRERPQSVQSGSDPPNETVPDRFPLPHWVPVDSVQRRYPHLPNRYWPQRLRQRLPLAHQRSVAGAVQWMQQRWQLRC